VRENDKEKRISYLPEVFSLVGKAFKNKFDATIDKKNLSPSQRYYFNNYRKVVSKALLFWMLTYQNWNASNSQDVQLETKKFKGKNLVTGVGKMNGAKNAAEKFVNIFWDRFKPGNVINSQTAKQQSPEQNAEDALVNNFLKLGINEKDSDKIIPRSNSFTAAASSSDPFYVQAMNYGAFTIKDDLGQWSDVYDNDWKLGPMGYAAKYRTGVITNLIYDNSDLHQKQIKDWIKTYFPGTVFRKEIYDFVKQDATNQNRFIVSKNKLTFNGDIDVVNVCMGVIATDPMIIRKFILSKNTKYGKIITYDNAKTIRSEIYKLLVSPNTNINELLHVCGIALFIFSFEDYDDELATKLGAGIDPKELNNDGDLSTALQMLDFTLAKAKLHIKFKYKGKEFFLGDPTASLFKNALLSVNNNDELNVIFSNQKDYAYPRELYKVKTNVDYYKKVGLDREFNEKELIKV
jgi:hypothetical protein